MKEVLIKSPELTPPLQGAHEEEDWDFDISPRSSVFNLHLKEIWLYRDLLVMFIKRDIVTIYKQTILGPLWFVLQPLLTSLTYILIFGRFAGISTDGIPHLLFYLSGITLWEFFAGTFTATSSTFKENEHIFGKVYFPRLIMPLSKVASSLIKFGIQSILLLIVYAYYLITDSSVSPGSALSYMPVFLLIMSALGVGGGIIFSALTTKYRDLVFLLTFGIQLIMFMTPVIYPISIIPDRFRIFVQLNPITPIVEGFREGLCGAGSFEPLYLIYSAVFAFVLLITGIIIFNRTERTFMDTI